MAHGWRLQAHVAQAEGRLFDNVIPDGEDWQNASSCGVYYLQPDGKAVNNVPYLMYTAKKSFAGQANIHPLMQFPQLSSQSIGSLTRVFS